MQAAAPKGMPAHVPAPCAWAFMRRVSTRRLQPSRGRPGQYRNIIIKES